MNINEAKRKARTILENPDTQVIPAFVGDTGVGKTQAAKQLAAEMGLAFSYDNVVDRQPGEYATSYVGHDDILHHAVDPMFQPDTLILFDELNRNQLVMGEVMNIFQSKKVRGQEVQAKMIVAMNIGEYDVDEMDPAQRRRLVFLPIHTDINIFSTYISARHPKPETAVLLSFLKKTNTLFGHHGAVNPAIWEEVLILGNDFIRDLLPETLAEDYLEFISLSNLPAYDEVTAQNFPNRWLELEYALGAKDEPMDVLANVATLLSVDSLGIFFEELAKRAPSKHTKLIKNKTFGQHWNMVFPNGNRL